MLQTIGGAFVPFRNQTPEPGALYLSRMGAVEAAPIKGPTEDPNRLLAIDTFGAQGMTSQVFALSVLAWRKRQQGDPRMLAVQTAAQDWATAWSSASATAVADLYAPTATLTDDLMGVRTQSRDEVTALTTLPAEAGGLDQVTIARSDVSGPAIFVVTPPGLHHSDPIRSTAMLVTTQGDRCPGHLAVVLDLDEQGRITHEQRYHRVDTLSRCIGAGPGDAESGPRWWDAVTIPPAVAKIQTGSLTLDGRDVAMFNSTPGLDGLITWAADRFTAAGLTPPTVTEVSFYGEHLDVCKGMHGRINGLATGTTLALCFVEKTACTDPTTCTQWTAQAKSTALHELGHMWIWAGLDTHTIDDAVTRRFTKQAGLPTWADTDHKWQDRGMELAASTIAWALTDDPFVHPYFADRCIELRSLFTTLTGKPAPTTAQCPEV